MRHRIVALAAGGLLVLGLAGCGGDTSGLQVASIGDADDPSASDQDTDQPALDPDERARQFAACMREQGIDMPDPEPGSGIRVQAPGSGADREAMGAALQECRHLMPEGAQRQEMSPEDQQRMREFAACMRDNGVDMPDPDPESGRVIIGGNGQMRPDDPAFQAALEACRDLSPNVGPRMGGNG